MPKGFHFVDGVMVSDADAAQAAAGATVPLAVVASTADLAEASAKAKADGSTVSIPAATVVAIDQFDEPKFVEKFDLPAGTASAPQVTGDDIFAGIQRVFSRHEVPLTMLSRLLALAECDVDMLMDDSTSMGAPTDELVGEACPIMQAALGRDPKSKVSRWEEAEDKLHIMMDFLAYIPTGPIRIHFLNRPTEIILDRAGSTPEQFADNAHKLIRAEFAKVAAVPHTPLYGKLEESFKRSTRKTKHYVFTDGEPNDRSPGDVKMLIKDRRHPAHHPVTFISCTDKPKEIEWLEDLEQHAPVVAVVNWYGDEVVEIGAKQGKAFPYSYGVHLMQLFEATEGPDDLNNLDNEDYPFSFATLGLFLGRNPNQDEYKYYWDNHPCGAKNAKYYDEFADPKSGLCARQIMEKHGGPSLSGAAAAVGGAFSRLGLGRPS